MDGGNTEKYLQQFRPRQWRYSTVGHDCSRQSLGTPAIHGGRIQQSILSPPPRALLSRRSSTLGPHVDDFCGSRHDSGFFNCPLPCAIGSSYRSLSFAVLVSARTKMWFIKCFRSINRQSIPSLRVAAYDSIPTFRALLIQEDRCRNDGRVVYPYRSRQRDRDREHSVS
jgi:hypothetical protein